ncbi:MAG: hypothetical protein H2069_07180 [Legionella sp.]|nr:hypothetical protein [Legionella sp.]
MLGNKVSAIVSNEARLERIIHRLLLKTVDRHAISIQGSPTQIAEKYGTPYVEPSVIQQSNNPPKQEFFLEDDYGWALGFSFAIPFFLCIVVAVFLLGDVQSIKDNLIYGSLGAVVGLFAGWAVATLVKHHQKRWIQAQESRGGFVLWVTVTSDEQAMKVVRILKRFRAHAIRRE